ncbi:Monooxygenase FAD-binding protein [Macrophomina phaseolina MS6]|uniref:Monooxygenase FAD-binding protein n=1 Tax=Macrophomina phaseolina (strain MS6) TaxID=1126212 RepID=K2RK41_MACPH|nr:Monooxygenase FAD-binding protein [Macrophomina phaseolina MS6]
MTERTQAGQQEEFGQQAASQISADVSSHRPIRLILPAFPLKNPNLTKVLGAARPDLGEELALERLERLCGDIESVYAPGARLCIVSDGVVYGDLMGVLDRDAFRYGEELRALAMTKACRHIEFVRVMDVLERRGGSAGGFAGDISAEQAYQSAAPGLRAELERSFLDRAFDVDRELEANPNTRLTFAGFVKLLARDMRWGRHFDRALLDDKRQYDKAVEEVARAMVRRLVAYENLLREKFADYVRLSIHPSKKGDEKIYIPLLPRKDDPGMNPWNCCVALMANGEVRTGYSEDFAEKYDLVRWDGRPYYFKEKICSSLDG